MVILLSRLIVDYSLLAVIRLLLVQFVVFDNKQL